MKTFSIKKKQVEQKWYLVDAQDLVLGRMATIVAKILRAKHKPTLTPHMDHGDRIIVINAEKIHLTGNKYDTKVYYHHTGYPGGIKENYAKKILQGPHGQRVVEKAVERMLGSNGPLRRQRMKNLFVYCGSNHPHEAQRPEVLPIGSWSHKNSKQENRI